MTRMAYKILAGILLCTGMASAQQSALAGRAGQNLQRAFVPNRLLVKYRNGAASAAARQIPRAAGSAKMRQIHPLGIFAIELAAGTDLEQAKAALAQDPAVEFVEYDYFVYAEDRLPNDPDFSKQWGLHNTGQTVNRIRGRADADIDAPEAWENTTGSNQVVIAVIDAGVAWDHPDLQANIWQNSRENSDNRDTDGNGYVDDVRGWDFVERDNDPYDYNGHGTHVAGIAAAVGNNGLGISGVSWNAQIMPLRVLDATGVGTSADVIEAFAYAVRNGARIINASFGSGSSNNSEIAVIQAARNAGVLLVAAAGNNGRDNDFSGHYPSNYELDNIIAVAATDQNDALANFSNYGRSLVDVAAPGVNIYSTLPPKPAELFFDDMESGAGNWEVDSPWALTTSRAVSPTHSWTDSPFDNYGPNVNIALALKKAVKLKGYQGAKLSFKLWIDTDTNYGILFIEASANRSSWTSLSQVAGNSNGAWVDWEADLKQFNRSDSVFIRFRFANNYPYNSGRDGVYIDDVRLTAYPAGGRTFAGDEYDYFSGTSMATPHVSGLAALIWAKTPALSYQQVRKIIFENGDKLSGLTSRLATGSRINAAASTLETAKLAVKLTPAPFTFTLNWGDTARASLLFKNSGRMKLEFFINDTDSGSTSASRLANAAAASNNPAAAPSLALLAAENSTAHINDVRDKLLATGNFVSVTGINVSSVTPTLAELQAYDAVLVWSNSSFRDAVALGTTLADYVDQGGGVVTAMFEMYSSGYNLFGRWDAEQDFVIPRGSYVTGSAALGTIAVPGHPIMDGVSTFSGGFNAFRPFSTSLTAGATLIASWSDGRPLVAVKEINERRRVDLGFFPPSNSVQSGFWEANTDGAKLMANALLWVIGNATNDWLAFSTRAGVVPPQDSLVIAAKINTANLIPGKTYYKSLQVIHNDPSQKNLKIPAALTINPADYFFTLSQPQQNVSGQSGDTLAYRLTLNNLGQASDSYNLSVAASPWPATIWDAAGKNRITQLGPVATRASAGFVVKIAIPANATLGARNLATAKIVSAGNAAMTRTSTIQSASLGPRIALPFLETFSSTALNPSYWTTTSGTPTITTRGPNPPSPPNSLELKSSSIIDQLESKPLDLSKQTGVVLSYYYQVGYPYFGSELVVSYYDGANWVDLARHRSEQTNSGFYQRHQVKLPAAASHKSFKLRFNNSRVDFSVIWFLDDIALSAPPELRVRPDSFMVKLPAGNSESRAMLLENRGGGALRFKLTSTGAGTNSHAFTLSTPAAPAFQPDGSTASSAVARITPREFSNRGAVKLLDLSGVKILRDRYHSQREISGWATIVNDLTRRGAAVTENTSFISAGVLQAQDVLWIHEGNNSWSSSEIAAIQAWLSAGGALLIEGDESANFFNNLLQTTGIRYTGYPGKSGTTRQIFSHLTTLGVKQIGLSNPQDTLNVSSPASPLILDVNGSVNTAYSLYGAGKILAMADENFSDASIALADNQVFANRVFDWLAGAATPASWITFAPDSGTLAPGASQTVQVTFDASRLAGESTYQAAILLDTNAPGYENFYAPVTLVTSKACGAPSHFQFTANTGNSYQIIIDTAQLDGKALTVCDEIAVFTPAGLCVGASVVDGKWPLGLTAWQDDAQTPGVDGYKPDEVMSFRIWHTDTAKTDYAGLPTYNVGDGKFGSGAFSRLSLLEATTGETQTLALRSGWNWISMNVQPPDLSVEKVLGKLRRLVFAANGAGEFYIPNVINQIAQFNVTESYKLYLSAAETLQTGGKRVPANTPIILPAKWSLVSYLPAQPLDAETALASLRPNLSIARDDSGRFYIPGKVNSLGKMYPGRGYEIHLSAKDTLIYPSGAGKMSATLAVQRQRQPLHFQPPRWSGESFSILVTAIRVSAAIAPGDEIGIFTAAGLLVGAGAWNGEEILALAAWRDDDRTEARDGYLPGEAMNFKFWDASANQEITLNANFEIGDGAFANSPYAVVALQSEQLPTHYALAQNYPNPFWSAATSRFAGNPTTKIKFALPSRSRVKITVYNILGKAVRTLAEETLEAGYHETVWDGKNAGGAAVASGIYFCRMEAEQFSAQIRLVLLK